MASDETRKRYQAQIQAIAAEHDSIGVFAIMMTEEGEILFGCAIDQEDAESDRAAPFRGLISINQASVKAIIAALAVARAKEADEVVAAISPAITFEDPGDEGFS